MSKPVICFDLDGTLVDHHGRMHPNDVAILQHEDRAVFVAATGRPLHSVRVALARNGLSFDAAIPFPLILQNGAVVYRPGEDLFDCTVFPADKQAALIDIGQRHPQVSCFLFSPERLELMWPTDHSLSMTQRFDLNVVPFEPSDHRYTKFMFMSETVDALTPLVDEIAPLSIEASFSLPTVYELTPTGIDKGRMLLNLLAGMGLASSQIVVAGDGGNDLPLFDVAHHSFCPEGSVTAVQQKANATINVQQTGLLAPMLQAAGIAVSMP